MEVKGYINGINYGIDYVIFDIEDENNNIELSVNNIEIIDVVMLDVEEEDIILDDFVDTKIIGFTTLEENSKINTIILETDEGKIILKGDDLSIDKQNLAEELDYYNDDDYTDDFDDEIPFEDEDDDY